VDATTPAADLLRYLADIGWEEVRRRPSAAPRASAAAASESPGPALAGALDELAAEAAACRRCRLAEGRHSVVFGCGDPHARLMVVGEAPGAEEDRQGQPFVGRAGAKLNQILAAIGLSREQVYIANVVKCRPPGNRDPHADEAAACRGYLETQIDLVRPRVLLALGRVAAQALLGTDSTLRQLRGQWFEVRGVPTRVTYHPAALLRSDEYRRPTWEDMQLVRDRLAATP